MANLNNPTPAALGTLPEAAPKLDEGRQVNDAPRFPPVNVQTVRRFVEGIHKAAAAACADIDQPGDLQLFRISPTNAKDQCTYRFPIGAVDAMTDQAIADAMAGYNVYAEGRTVDKNTPRGKRGDRAATRAVFALVADDDRDKGKAAVDRLEPSLVVETSTGNSHRWIFLARALGHEEAANLGKRMRDAMGGDADTGVPTQPYRVAGTPNFPGAAKQARGRLIEPTTILEHGGHAYSIEELASAFPADEPQPVVEDGPQVEEGVPRDIEELLKACSLKRIEQLGETSEQMQARGTDRSSALMPVVGFLRGDGFSLIEAVTLLHHFPGSGFIEKYGDRIDVETERLWNKVTDRPNQGKPPGGTITQDQVAQCFAREFGERLRYCHHTGAWFEWCGSHWRRNETARAFYYGRELGRRMTAAATDGDKKQVRSVTFAGGVEKFAKSDPVFAVTSERWDRDTFLLGTPGGTVDLRTGILREPDQADCITKVTAVAPADAIDCPRWLQFLDETFGGDALIIRFVQQWCGYCLTGDTREHALVFGYGGGGNGKSVFLSVITGILQDYAVTAAMDTFIASQSERHPTDLAMLRGARMVTASETEEGRAWAESRIKQITGGDKITARFMRQDFFEFRPQFKLTIIGNNKPVLKNPDEAARRRFNLVPFLLKPAKPDKDLEEKLRAEWPGILRWAIAGCLDWQANGLIRPEAVVAATQDYFQEQDLIGQWLEEECDAEPGNPHKVATNAELFESWAKFAHEGGENAGTQNKLNDALRKRGFEKCRIGHSGTRGFRGIRVKPKPSFHSAGDDRD